MPYGPVRESPRDKFLTDSECDQRIEELQKEQMERLRWGLGDDLYDWREDFEQDMDILGTELEKIGDGSKP
jgi:hypothetical protein